MASAGLDTVTCFTSRAETTQHWVENGAEGVAAEWVAAELRSCPLVDFMYSFCRRETAALQISHLVFLLNKTKAAIQLSCNNLERPREVPLLWAGLPHVQQGCRKGRSAGRAGCGTRSWASSKFRYCQTLICSGGAWGY